MNKFLLIYRWITFSSKLLLLIRPFFSDHMVDANSCKMFEKRNNLTLKNGWLVICCVNDLLQSQSLAKKGHKVDRNDESKISNKISHVVCDHLLTTIWQNMKINKSSNWSGKREMCMLVSERYMSVDDQSHVWGDWT